MPSTPFRFSLKHTSSIPPISLSSSFILGHISASALPDGCHLDMWVLHTRDTKLIDVGSHITFYRSSTDLTNKDRKINPLPTAIVTGVAYCNSDQVVFRIHMSQPSYPSLLSTPLHATRIGTLRKAWYQTQSRFLPPPPIHPTLRNRKSELSNISRHNLA